MTNRTRVTLITALTTLSLNAGRVWLTGTLKSSRCWQSAAASSCGRWSVISNGG